MENKVLVAYASTHGSTQEVAGVVATTLREHGLTVDLQTARQVRSLEGYGAAVLGASARIRKQWQRVDIGVRRLLDG